MQAAIENQVEINNIFFEGKDEKFLETLNNQCQRTINKVNQTLIEIQNESSEEKEN